MVQSSIGARCPASLASARRPLDGTRRQLPAGLALVDGEHRLARLRSRDRGREARRPEADHEHVGEAMHALAIARDVELRDRAAARDAPHQRLDLGPQPARLDQRLVVEAGRGGSGACGRARPAGRGPDARPARRLAVMPSLAAHSRSARRARRRPARGSSGSRRSCTGIRGGGGT